uniref:Syndecan n=2 Tax=Xenopus tropicalis TaxID=8364 RepID=A0A6I8PYW4_XENTR
MMVLQYREGRSEAKGRMYLAFGIIQGAGLLFIITQSALAERWRSEFEDERPVDLESSGDDDLFEDEDMDDVYSGSGSGNFELESGLDLGFRFTTKTPISPPTVTALKPAPTDDFLPPVQSTWVPPTTQASVVHRHNPWVPPEAPDTPSLPAAPTPTIPSKQAATTEATATETVRTTEVRRLQPVVVVSTEIMATPSSTDKDMFTWEATDEQEVTSFNTESGRVWPTEDWRTSVEDIKVEETEKVSPTLQPQTESWEVTAVTSRDSDFEIPISGGPSGDFEIQEEDVVPQTEPPTLPDLGNEVLLPATAPPDLARGRKPDTGLIDNTIDSGNTLAQMPQKNILERREVLIAVIVGGVVGALFAAFLVMLLIYRMKKKDEGSYALEEPKPASVSYQKPETHEEFYA